MASIILNALLWAMEIIGWIGVILLYIGGAMIDVRGDGWWKTVGIPSVFCIVLVVIPLVVWNT